MSQPQLIIISGPSGVGKTTIVHGVLQASDLPLVLSVSATTRTPRPQEQDGVDYHFLGDEEFETRRDAGEFLECCEVFGRGHWYGTLKSTVDTSLDEGKWVILEIDVEGAMKVFQKRPEATTIFIRPDTIEELERRLRNRQTETEDKIQERLARSRHELSFADRYKHTVINVDVDQTIAEICGILNNLRAESGA